MKRLNVIRVLFLLALDGSNAQQTAVHPQVRTSSAEDHKVAIVEITPHFITTIRVPEAVNSVALGDPALFEVEHSEREPELVFIKALTMKSAESNLLISTIKGRQISLLLVTRGETASPSAVDFLLRYERDTGFLIEPEALPSALVPATATLRQAPVVPAVDEKVSSPSQVESDALDGLLEQQKRAPLPVLSSKRNRMTEVKGDRLRAGISEVLDHNQQVVVLFSVVNASRDPILLMPPQVQLGGKQKAGRLIRHEHWSVAEQLTVTDFRLSSRRIGPGERADGVVEFERPSHKQSTEALFLQIADSGAVDKPALVPIGFGINSTSEESNHAQ